MFPKWQIQEDYLNWQVHPDGKNGHLRFGQWFINKHKIKDASDIFYCKDHQKALQLILEKLSIKE